MASNLQNGGTRRGNRWSMAIWGTAALLLLIPLVAMQFTTEVSWTGSDFVVMGALLAIACGSYGVATRLSDSPYYRAGAGVAVLTGFVTIWVNLAVGMLGGEDNPANLLFGVVLLVGVVGALIACFRPRGMARAIVATGLAQAVMAVYALVAGHSEVVLLIGLFVIPWLVSAQLLQTAARKQLPLGAAT